MNEKVKKEVEEMLKKYAFGSYEGRFERFIDHIDYHDWSTISIYRNLSEDFIREFKDYVNWMYITIKQNLSESFIREFKDKIWWTHLKMENLSSDFIWEMKEIMGEDTFNLCLRYGYIDEKIHSRFEILDI